MKVKVGNTVYDGAIEPVMVILSPKDKENIAKMLPECSKYCAYPKSANETIDDFMVTDESRQINPEPPLSDLLAPSSILHDPYEGHLRLLEHPVVKEIESLGWHVHYEVKRGQRFSAYAWTRDRQVSQDAITTPEYELDMATKSPVDAFRYILDSVRLYYEDHPLDDFPLDCTSRENLVECIKQFCMRFQVDSVDLHISDKDAECIKNWGSDQLGSVDENFVHEVLFVKKQFFGHRVEPHASSSYINFKQR